MKIILCFFLLFVNIYGFKYKIFYVNSYDYGYEWSDKIEHTFCSKFGIYNYGNSTLVHNDSVEIKIFRMNTKIHHNESYIRSVAKKVYSEYLLYRPNIVVASDDNSNKYFVVPYLIKDSIDVVFCGINFGSEKYGYPTKHITGIEEYMSYKILPAIFNDSNMFSKKIAVLGPDDNSTKNRLINLKEKKYIVKPFLANNMNDWCSYYKKIQDEFDYVMIYYPDLKWWDLDMFMNIVNKNTKIPAIGFYGVSVPYSLVVIETSPKIQGLAVAYIVKKVLFEGKKISSIKVIKKNPPNIVINAKLLRKLKIKINSYYLYNSNIFGE